MSFPVQKGPLIKEEFDILDYLFENHTNLIDINDLLASTKYNVENSVIDNLKFKGFISDNLSLTEKGYDALEPYRVKNACLLAAGFGERLLPITINTPKPMVNVCGTRIIDTLLDAITDAEIENIFIVRGYLKEQFNLLLEKYPKIQFIDNPYYKETNNISSAMMFGEHISNSYIMESDLFLRNSKLIKRYQYSSNYVGIPVEETNDHCFFIKNGIITGTQIGGKNCYQTVGITYWDSEDGERLSNQIKDVFYNKENGKQQFFGAVPTRFYKDDYQIGVRECKLSDVIEIDSYKELVEIDNRYIAKLE